VVGAAVPEQVEELDSDEIEATELVEVAESVELEVADEVDGEQPPIPPPAPVAEPEPPAPEPVASSAADPGRKSPSRKVAGWYDDVFAEHFAALRRKQLGKAAKADVEFFVQSSGLQSGASVLDVGCGDGAHSITLAQRGFSVTGLDNSSAQLSRATAAANKLGVGIDFKAGDMRDMELGRTFDGILCLGTTFGYFDDDVNRNVLRNLREHLAPNGRLLLQLFNRDYMASRLPARSWWQGHGCLVLDEAEMNYFNNRLHVHRTIVFEDGRQFTHDIYVRSYGAYELGRMCVDVGLRAVEISGSRHTRGRFWGATSPEIWLVLERT
jgi:SAM-dependent methyltransferase